MLVCKYFKIHKMNEVERKTVLLIFLAVTIEIDRLVETSKAYQEQGHNHE